MTEWTVGSEIPKLEVPSFHNLFKPLGEFDNVNKALEALEKGHVTCDKGITSVYSKEQKKQIMLVRSGYAEAADTAKKDAKAETLMYLGRFAAHIHNSVRYNRISLLDKVNKAAKERLASEVDAYIYLKLLFSLVCLLALPAAYGHLDASSAIHHIIDAKKCGCILVAVVLGLTFLQWLLGNLMLERRDEVRSTVDGRVETARITSLDVSSGNYKFVFWVYYWMFKIWQSWVIKPVASGLMYGNQQIWKSAYIPHTGVFVVGYAVNVVQSILICYFTFAAATRELTWLTATAAAIIAVSLQGLEFLFGPSDIVKTDIDYTLKTSPCGEIFERMENFTSFTVEVHELYLLQEELDPDNKFRIYPPGSTHTLTILLDVGSYYGGKPAVERFDVSKPKHLKEKDHLKEKTH
jgi:hypothetical protein